MKNLTFDNFKVDTCPLTLVEFWDKNCYACFLAQEYLEDLEKAYKERCVIAKINILEEAQVIEIYSIKLLPTFILFKEGIVLGKIEGFRKKDNIEKLIRSHI